MSDSIAYKFDFDGACRPEVDQRFITNTFSVGIFQWIPKKSGNGLKKSRVLRRIRGYSSQPEKVYEEAKILCDALQEECGFNLHPLLKKGD